MRMTPVGERCQHSAQYVSDTATSFQASNTIQHTTLLCHERWFNKEFWHTFLSSRYEGQCVRRTWCRSRLSWSQWHDRVAEPGASRPHIALRVSSGSCSHRKHPHSKTVNISKCTLKHLNKTIGKASINIVTYTRVIQELKFHHIWRQNTLGIAFD